MYPIGGLRTWEILWTFWGKIKEKLIREILRIQCGNFEVILKDIGKTLHEFLGENFGKWSNFGKNNI